MTETGKGRIEVPADWGKHIANHSCILLDDLQAVAGNPNAYNREPFSKEEVARIWEVKDSNIYYTVVLMLIYTGCRISELLDLRKEDINLQERWFKVIAAKTAAGIRTVPIAEKVVPFFEYWYNLNSCKYLLSTPDGKHLNTEIIMIVTGRPL